MSRPAARSRPYRPDQVTRPDAGVPAGADEQPRGGAAGHPARTLPAGPAPCRPAPRSLSARKPTCGISSSSSTAPPASCASLTAASATSMRSNSSAERLDDDPEPVEIVPEQALAERRTGEVEPSGPQVGDRRHLVDGDRRAGDLLDRLQHPVLARLGQRDGDALPPGAADPADPVHVELRRRRDVVVDDVGQLLDVQTAGGDVGGDEQVRRPAAEPAHHPVALLLAHAAVQRLGAIAAAVEGLGQ